MECRFNSNWDHLSSQAFFDDKILSFPNDEAATKLIYLAVQHIAKRWTKPIQNWKAALNQFAILFEGRVPLSMAADEAEALLAARKFHKSTGCAGDGD